MLLSENFLGLFGTGKLLNSFPKNCTLLTARRILIALPKNRTQQSWQILGLNSMSFSSMHSTYFALLLKQAHRLMILVWFDQPSDHTIYKTPICLQKYITIELKLITPKLDTKTPKKPAGGKMGNMYPRPRQWCHPWGVSVLYTFE